ncbi:hypothetical protein K0M31_017815 [Melipona bicolor]|uniref:Uncharacterized protein n=1 Tax=Melipona bicolor TaxID=60889 RepID=A0AA40G6D9_9HYME|nr:hypothetical protein K0M31_017815 [Melipona bicolor]
MIERNNRNTRREIPKHQQAAREAVERRLNSTRVKIMNRRAEREEDWERELEAELKDYEVVTGNEERNTVTTPVRSGDVLDKDWERQIDELLANDDEEGDLK